MGLFLIFFFFAPGFTKSLTRIPFLQSFELSNICTAFAASPSLANSTSACVLDDCVTTKSKPRGFSSSSAFCPGCLTRTFTTSPAAENISLISSTRQSAFVVLKFSTTVVRACVASKSISGSGSMRRTAVPSSFISTTTLGTVLNASGTTSGHAVSTSFDFAAARTSLANFGQSQHITRKGTQPSTSAAMRSRNHASVTTLLSLKYHSSCFTHAASAASDATTAFGASADAREASGTTSGTVASTSSSTRNAPSPSAMASRCAARASRVCSVIPAHAHHDVAHVCTYARTHAHAHLNSHETYIVVSVDRPHATRWCCR